MVAIRNRTTLNGSHEQRRANARFYLAAPEEMAHRFRSRPDAAAHTLEIAERCAAFDLTQDLGYTFPDFDGSDRGGAIETLKAVCLGKLDERYRDSKLEAEARERLSQELGLVDRHGLAGFSWSTGTSWSWPGMWRPRSGAAPRGPTPACLRDGDGAPPCRRSSAT